MATLHLYLHWSNALPATQAATVTLWALHFQLENVTLVWTRDELFWYYRLCVNIVWHCPYRRLLLYCSLHFECTHRYIIHCDMVYSHVQLHSLYSPGFFMNLDGVTGNRCQRGGYCTAGSSASFAWYLFIFLTWKYCTSVLRYMVVLLSCTVRLEHLTIKLAVEIQVLVCLAVCTIGLYVFNFFK